MSRSWTGFVAQNQAVKFHWAIMELEKAELEKALKALSATQHPGIEDQQEDGFGFILLKEPEDG